MGFNRDKISCLALLLGLATLNVNAKQSSLKVLEFELLPLACVAKVIGEPCHMVSQLTWRSNEQGDLCFWQDDAKLMCWQGQKKVEQNIDLTLKKESQFKLLLQDDKTVLAQQQVKINYLQSKYRRKLRAKWSIF